MTNPAGPAAARPTPLGDEAAGQVSGHGSPKIVRYVRNPTLLRELGLVVSEPFQGTLLFGGRS